MERKALLKNKNKYKKVNRCGKVKKLFFTTLLVLFGSYGAYNTIVPKIQSNQINQNVEYYGGSQSYLGMDKFNFGYNKFVTKDTKHIQVAVSDKFDDRYYEQIEHYYDYLNSIFDEINPEYHFELKRNDGYYDILIDAQSFYEKDYPENASAVTYNNISFLNLHNIKSSTIYFNSDIMLSDSQIRFMLAHEMMHTLLGNQDIGMVEDLPLSLLGYIQLDEIIKTVNTYKGFSDKEKNKYIKNEFVTYMPYDLSAIISVYSNKNNSEKNIKLLNKTLENCKKIFGENNKFYEDGYVLPSVENNEELSR